jgi:hypothetical protein
MGVLIAMMAVAAAHNVAPHDPRLNRLKARESQYTAGILRKDPALMARVFSSDFFDTSPKATVLRKAEYLTQLKDPSWHASRIDVWDYVYLIHGNSAVVEAQYKFSGIDHGKLITEAGRATDVWVWENGDWWCVAAHSSVKGR